MGTRCLTMTEPHRQLDEIVEAARRLLDDLLPRLKTNCPAADDQPIELLGARKWRPDVVLGPGARRYVGFTTFYSAEQQCGVRMLGELRTEGLQSISELEQALAADP